MFLDGDRSSTGVVLYAGALLYSRENGRDWKWDYSGRTVYIRPGTGMGARIRRGGTKT